MEQNEALHQMHKVKNKYKKYVAIFVGTLSIENFRHFLFSSNTFVYLKIYFSSISELYDQKRKAIRCLSLNCPLKRKI